MRDHRAEKRASLSALGLVAAVVLALVVIVADVVTGSFADLERELDRTAVLGHQVEREPAP